MKYQKNKSWFSQAMTMVEILIALAIMAIIFAAVLPQFRIIQNSWESKVGASETLQNGRILIVHLNRNLSKAARITAVSDSSDTNGYIEFIDNDANNVRYDISASNYVEFGPVGNLSDLAGPVSKLQFTCYGAVDLSTPITDVNSIRCVKVEMTLTNPAKFDQDMTFSTQAYIRTNALPAVGGNITKLSEPWKEFNTVNGQEPALAHNSGTDFWCVYRGDRDDGFLRPMTVRTTDWGVDAFTTLEYDTKQGITPDLAKIDDTNFLCAYQGDRGDGWACILYKGSSLQRGPEVEFDTSDCIHPALSKIYTQGDDHYFLCVYFDNASSVKMVVLKATIIPSRQLTCGPTTSFACDLVCQPALIRIDDTHHLCAYRGSNLRLWAVVLTVDPASGTVTTETPFEVAPSLYAYEPTLAQIDNTHYLYAFNSNIGQACVVTLTVNTSDWTITKDTTYDYYQFSDAASSLDLCKIDSTSFLCVYEGGGGSGLATVLTVNTSNWSLSNGVPLTFETVTCSEPVLCQIDAIHYLCAYAGVDDDGFVGVLELSGGLLP
jgi:prepilin-type N-terminal cleavage/methylation domain-containing protein